MYWLAWRLNTLLVILLTAGSDGIRPKPPAPTEAADSRFLSREASHAAVNVDRQQADCPANYRLKGDAADEKMPAFLQTETIKTVKSFTVDYPDVWWTRQRVDQARASLVELPAEPSYEIAPSPINVCGVYAKRNITAGEKIDVAWAADDSPWLPSFMQKVAIHVTPWYGYGMNHCSREEKVNVRIEEQSDGKIAMGVAARDIEKGEEMLLNYNKIFMQYPFRIMPAWPFWSC